MKVENTKFVAVNYTLTVDGQVADKNPEGQPLEFVCGAGMLLPKFEGALIGKEPGDKVSFTLEPKDGYGELIAEAIVELPKTIFMIDGKVVEEMLFVGNVVPMSDAEGHRMNGIIREVKEETIMMDFNHPMAGKTLNFDVEVVEVRDVTPEGRELREISVNETVDVALSHLSLMIENKGERAGIAESRKHLGWYMKGIRGAAELRNRINTAESLDELTEILSTLKEI